MPPRIRSSSCQAQLLLTCIEPTPSSSLSFPTAALAPLHRPTASSSSSSSPSPTCHRAFSTTPAPQDTRLRRQFKDWAESNKTVFRRPLAQPGTNYLGRVIPTSDGQKPTPAMPFPTNPHFQSQRVLSEKARELIWREVMVLGTPIKAVSAKYFVDMRRVAAVVRMKEIEKKWVQEVSFFSFFAFPFGFHDDMQQNSISLEDLPVVKQCSMSDKASIALFLVFPFLLSHRGHTD